MSSILRLRRVPVRRQRIALSDGRELAVPCLYDSVLAFEGDDDILLICEQNGKAVSKHLTSCACVDGCIFKKAALDGAVCPLVNRRYVIADEDPDARIVLHPEEEQEDRPEPKEPVPVAPVIPEPVAPKKRTTVKPQPSGFGKFLKQYRLSIGMSRVALSILCGLSSGMIYQIESGRAKVTPHIRQCICEAIPDFDPEYLFRTSQEESDDGAQA